MVRGRVSIASVQPNKYLERLRRNYTSPEHYYFGGNHDTHVIAWKLCIEYEGEWVSYQTLRNSYMGSKPDEIDAFKRTIDELRRHGLVEGTNVFVTEEGQSAWEKCIEEERRRRERDSRITRSPEERCLSKVEHDYMIRATPTLCEWLAEYLVNKHRTGRLRIYNLGEILARLKRAARKAQDRGAPAEQKWGAAQGVEAPLGVPAPQVGARI